LGNLACFDGCSGNRAYARRTLGKLGVRRRGRTGNRAHLPTRDVFIDGQPAMKASRARR